jgi:hypothetical protein
MEGVVQIILIKKSYIGRREQMQIVLPSLEQIIFIQLTNSKRFSNSAGCKKLKAGENPDI